MVVCASAAGQVLQYLLPFCLMLRRCGIPGQPMNFLVLLVAAVTKAG